jgi:hypothetical protein
VEAGAGLAVAMSASGLPVVHVGVYAVRICISHEVVSVLQNLMCCCLPACVRTGHFFNGFTWRLKLTVKPPDPGSPNEMNIHVGLCWGIEVEGEGPLPLSENTMVQVRTAWGISYACACACAWTCMNFCCRKLLHTAF